MFSCVLLYIAYVKEMSYVMLCYDLFTIQVHSYDKIQLNTYHDRKQQKTRLTRDSEVPGRLPWSELNHYLKGLWKPSLQADTTKIKKKK